MMVLGTSKLTRKSHVTVPKSARAIFGLKAGYLLVFVKDHEITGKRGKVEI
jgi:bifunctional DNA-binding transcriptional regulator/antitoxin component of YhaV-PrlF toxin-antitoxin module